tara:strand:- start:687 stop:1019 length:333 start_codon:yes stop_codon:yes gene_type:complete
MLKKKSDDKITLKKTAVDKINSLFKEAEKTFKKDSKLADNYVKKARRAAQRVRMPIPSEYRKRFCKYCGKYWVPGKTVRVRLQKQKVVYFCLSCKRHTRHPYVKEKKAKK